MRVLLVTAVFAALLFGWVRWQERAAVFFPTRGIDGYPRGIGLSSEDVFIETADGLRLHGWYVQGTSPVTVLWLHGNAGNIVDRLDILEAMTDHLGVSSLLFDFRGYGISEGRPSERGLYADAGAAFRWLTGVKGVAPGNVVIYGHSLGTAVAVDLSLGAGRAAAAAVLESPFTSARGMARMIYGGLPVHLLLSVRFDNEGRIGKLSMPLLVIHGEADTVIPIAMGRRVFEAAPEPKRLLAVPGGDHSDCFLAGGEKYWQAWRDLLDQIQPAES